MQHVQHTNQLQKHTKTDIDKSEEEESSLQTKGRSAWEWAIQLHNALQLFIISLVQNQAC